MSSSSSASASASSLVVADDDGDHDCPLCLEPFAPADRVYPLDCPWSKCHYRFCGRCLERLKKAAADDYQMASDGSMQVKIHMQCPQCRAKYEIGEHATFRAPVILQSVLLLRKAYSVENDYLKVPDSELAATKLSDKTEFLRQVSLEDLTDAVRRLQTYHQEIKKGVTIPPLSWELWRPVVVTTRSDLMEHSSLTDAPTMNRSRSGSSQQSLPPWRDPTLFLGLEELMTPAEQEFVTDLMVSGQVDQVVQGAQILNAILDISYTRQAMSTVQALSNFRTSGNHNNHHPRHNTRNNNHHHHHLSVSPSHRWKQKTVDLQKLRRKYPLPTRMPRCVRMPVSEHSFPTHSGFAPFQQEQRKHATFGMQFSNHDPNSLMLTAVKGPAGRVGLRKGDVVTHIQGEPVHSQAECWAHLEQIVQQEEMQQQQKQQQSSLSSTSTATVSPHDAGHVIILVNCDAETAQELKTRAETMQEEGVQIYV